jgi:hypothetical protein
LSEFLKYEVCPYIAVPVIAKWLKNQRYATMSSIVALENPIKAHSSKNASKKNRPVKI